jgi:hypothetical protein
MAANMLIDEHRHGIARTLLSKEPWRRSIRVLFGLMTWKSAWSELGRMG